MLTACQTRFTSRQALCEYVAQLAAQQPTDPSPIVGGHQAARKKLADISPKEYAITRNYLTGKVTHLSPYLRHGVISIKEVITQLEPPISC